MNWRDKNSLKLHMRSLLADIFVRHFSNVINECTDTIPFWLSQLLSEMEQSNNFIAGIERMVALSNKSREHLSRCIKNITELLLPNILMN